MQNILFAGGVGIISFSIISSLLYFFSKVKISKPKELPVSRLTITLSVIVFATILFLAKNIVPALVGVIIVVLIPSQITYFIQRKNKREALEQSAAAIKVFANEYALTLNIRSALQVAGDSTTGRVSDIFKNAYYQLSLGKSLDVILKNMGKQLGTSYGYLFTKLVSLAAQKGQMILPLFHDLVTRIRLAQEQENFKSTQTSVNNLFNLILIIFPVVEYILLLRFVPEVSSFIFGTQLGSLIFTAWLFSIVIWFAVDRLINEL